jgi:head-tail adaptor
VTGKPCDASFLDCFHCGNCLITTDHLPQLLGLLDALATRRRQLGESDWWRRYGQTWAAIRHDVMTKFSPAEITQAQRIKTDDALLDLVEHPWEKP